MRIAIDISPLQTGHRMRGIGTVAAHILSNLSNNDGSFYVLYALKQPDESALTSALSTLSLEDGSYAVRYILDGSTDKELPGKLRYVSKLSAMAHGYRRFARGDERFSEMDDIDVFLQLDQSMPIARATKRTKTMFIAYDLIPYIMEKSYLWSYRTSRKNKLSRKASLKRGLDRWMYLKKIKLNAKRADKIIAISETTKNDFVYYAGVDENKLSVCHLGVDRVSETQSSSGGIVDRYHETPWMYTTKKEDLSDSKYLLFVGGADERRRLDDLVAAYNNLRARGENIKLVLCGDIMKGPKNIPSSKVRNALESSSYRDDIYYLGYINEATKKWLYQHAVSFIFPSLYEGFGLPVLEAMSFGTPVICYETSAISEVAGEFPYYANDVETLMNQISTVLSLSDEQRSSYAEKAKNHTRRFTWRKTTEAIFAWIEPATNNKNTKGKK